MHQAQIYHFQKFCTIFVERLHMILESVGNCSKRYIEKYLSSLCDLYILGNNDRSSIFPRLPSNTVV